MTALSLKSWQQLQPSDAHIHPFDGLEGGWSLRSNRKTISRHIRPLHVDTSLFYFVSTAPNQYTGSSWDEIEYLLWMNDRNELFKSLAADFKSDYELSALPIEAKLKSLAFVQALSQNLPLPVYSYSGDDTVDFYFDKINNGKVIAGISSDDFYIVTDFSGDWKSVAISAKDAYSFANELQAVCSS